MSDETTPVEAGSPVPPAVEEAPAQPVSDEQTNDAVFKGIADDPEAIAQNNETEIAKTAEKLKASDGQVYLRLVRPIYVTAYNTVLDSGESVQVSHEPTEFDANSADEIIKNAAHDGVIVEKVGK